MNDKYQTQINEINKRLENMDKFWRKKAYKDGEMETKLDAIFSQVTDLTLEQKKLLKQLITDQESLEEKLNSRIEDQEKRINEIIMEINQIPSKLLKYAVGIIPITAIIIEIILNLPQLYALIGV